MSTFKKIIDNYNTNNVSGERLYAAVFSIEDIFHYVEENNKELFWKFMRKLHEEFYGKHFNECYANYEVSQMSHTDNNNIPRRGEMICIETARLLYNQEVKYINPNITCWDVYVALNAQYHDYYKLFKEWFNESEEDILSRIKQAAINFWFKDEDADDCKVWNYFNSK